MVLSGQNRLIGVQDLSDLDRLRELFETELNIEDRPLTTDELVDALGRADVLILNDTLPRSLASCYSNLVRNLDQIGVAYGRQGASQRHARGIRNRLEHSNMDDIFQHGVHEFIQEFIADNSRLGEIITKQYLI